MLKSFEATIDPDGAVHLKEQVHLPCACRAIVTIIDAGLEVPDTALLSETALAEDWNRPEEDEAWSHLRGQHSLSA
jgi:hypothetical protein